MGKNKNNNHGSQSKDAAEKQGNPMAAENNAKNQKNDSAKQNEKKSTKG